MEKSFKYDVLIIGDIAGIDLIFAESLTRMGLNCGVAKKIRKGSVNHMECVPMTAFYKNFDINNVIYFSTPQEFLTLAKTARLILSFTGALLGAMKYAWFIRHLLRLPPIINFSTGSDIAERSVEKSYKGYLYRSYLNFVDRNWCLNYPHVMKNIFRLRIPNVFFSSFPWSLVNDEKNDHKRYKDITVEDNEHLKIRFFHPSNFDWKQQDAGANRFSAKGNDRFIRAFARAVNNGLNADCIMLERGPDKENAKILVKNLGIEDRIIWKPHLTRDELIEEYEKADVVIDQFDVGGLGGIAIEAMSKAKPVMVYLHEECMRLTYKVMPPVLNCGTEEEIYEKIMLCRDKRMLHTLGEESKLWIHDNHSYGTCLDQFLFQYTFLTGHKTIDYGWENNFYR